MLRNIIQFTSLLALSAHVAQASHEEQVDAAVYILSDIEDYLATPFCSDYIHYHEHTSTYTVTNGPITVTTTVLPSTCSTTSKNTPSLISASPTTYPSTPIGPSQTDQTTINPTDSPTQPPPVSSSSSATHPIPWISTVSSTTTMTYITTSTIYVAASPMPLPDAPSTPSKRGIELYARDTWCSDYGVPCRLVQYSHDVIADACERFLGGGEVEYKTVTTWKYVTSTAVARDCAQTGAPVQGVYDGGLGSKEDGGYGDEYMPKNENNHGEPEEGDAGYGGSEVAGKENGMDESKYEDPSQDLEFMNEYCWDGNC